jgi:hypothetical protein
MRIDLTVPYAEKDQAKRWGAKWDAARRTWYIENVQNLAPLMRWMPEHLKRPSGTPPTLQLEHAPPVSGAKLRKLKKAEQRKKQREVARNTHFIAGPVTPRTDFSMFDPGCSCVPWEWCEHNPEPANPKTAFVYPTKPEYSFELAPENLAHIRSILAE